MMPRIVFMGSPEFAIPTLRALYEVYPIVGVVTQPDRPSGRGRKPVPPPIKTFAEERNLPYIQPERLRQPGVIDQLKQWNPDLIVVAAFGQILRPDVLNLPPKGCINVHASLLPRWRGAAPIQAALLHGDGQTGVTIMLMDPGIDTGPVISQRAMPILPTDTASNLGERLAELGASLLLDSLPDYLNGVLLPQLQDDTRATYARLLNKTDGLLDFNLPADQLERQVRAFNPWPGAYLEWMGGMLKIHHATVIPPDAVNACLAPGERGILQDLPAIGTAKDILLLDQVQPSGRQSMPGKAFLQGARNWST